MLLPHAASHQVVLVLDQEVTRATVVGDAAAAQKSYLSSFEGRRLRLTREDVDRIAKCVARESRIDSNDVAALERLVASWGEMTDSPLIYYQCQVHERCSCL
jgi:hypothetical protein